MCFASRLYAWVGGLALAAVLQPALAAGFHCNRASDVVEKTICASPKLSELDARLSTVYATTLVRDPAQAVAIKRDERDWLAHRDKQAWQWLSRPDIASGATKALTRLYQRRIGFLRNVDNPEAVGDVPLAQAALDAVPLLPAGSPDVLKSMEGSGLVMLPRTREVTGFGAVIASLPAPPDSKLRKSLHQFAKEQYFWLTDLPSVGLGGVVFADGPMGCRHWVVYKKEGRLTHYVQPPGVLGGCWNSRDYLALMDGHPVALDQTVGALSRNTNLRWRRWLNGRWGPTVQIRVRFDHGLKIGFASCDSSVNCEVFRSAAMQYAQRYDAHPLPETLQKGPSLTRSERDAFHQMVSFAKQAQQRSETQIGALWSAAGGPRNVDQQTWEDLQHKFGVIEQAAAEAVPNFRAGATAPARRGFGPSAPYFPARISGELLLGRIGPVRYGGIGGQNYYGFDWIVGLWRWRGGKLIPLAGFEVNRYLGRALLAARVLRTGATDNGNETHAAAANSSGTPAASASK